MRGFPGGSATGPYWGGRQLGASKGAAARLRIAADWVALEPRRPLGWPMIGGPTPVDGGFGAVIERAGTSPSGPTLRPCSGCATSAALDGVRPAP